MELLRPAKIMQQIDVLFRVIYVSCACQEEMTMGHLIKKDNTGVNTVLNTGVNTAVNT